MKKNIFNFEIMNTFFIFILGTLLHFSYQGNIISSIFSSVNESTWEHLKLLFFPMLISTIIGTYYYGKNYFYIKSKYIIYSLISMVVFFYTYNGIIGNNYPLIDISSFYIIVIIFQIKTYKAFLNNKQDNKIYPLLLVIFLLFFIVFTFNPPKLNLFKDPINNTYGI